MPMPTKLMQDTYWELWSLQRAHFRRCLEMVRGLIDHPAQAQVLHVISTRQGCTQRQLADALRVRPSTMAVTLGRMEKSALITRTPAPCDARALRVELTEHGERVYLQIIQCMHQLMDECFAQMSEREVAQLGELIQKVHENLNRRPAGSEQKA